MASVSLTIKSEPASKANQRMLVKFGNRPASIKSPKARSYEASARSQIPPSAMLMLSGRIRFTCTIFYASERPDLDESVILDVLQAKYKLIGGKRVLVRTGVYQNDRLVREKHVFHEIDRDNPRAVILIEEIEPTLLDEIATPAKQVVHPATLLGRPGPKVEE